MRSAPTRRWHARKPAGTRYPLLRWPLVLMLVLLAHLGGGWLASRIHLNNAPEVYYPKASASVALRDRLREDFPGDEVLTVLFTGKDLYTPAFLERLDRLAGVLEKHPLVDKVSSVTRLERIGGTSDGFSVERLVDVRKLEGATPEQIRARVFADRFAPGLLASRDGEALALAVRPKPLSESADRRTLRDAVLAAIDAAGLRSHYAGDAGPVSTDVAEMESIVHDTLTFVPLTVLIGLALLGWVVGRWRPVLIGAVAMSTVILPMLACVALAGQPYTMATAILPSLLAAYTLATLLHLYAATQRLQGDGRSKALAVDRALAETRKPGLYNVLTTGAGLLSLVLVPIPPIQVFGVAGAVGTLLVYFVVFHWVPPMLVRWDPKPWPVHGSGMGRLGRVASRMALFSMRHPWLMVCSAVVLVVASFPLAEKVRAESDVLLFFAPDHPVSRNTALIESKLAGVTSLELSLRGDRRDALQSLERLQAIKAFQRWIDALPEVDRSVSMVDLIEEMNWAMNEEDAAARALPKSERLLKQYLLVYDGNDLYELVNRDFSHARMVLNLKVHGAREIGQTIDHIRRYLVVHPMPGVAVEVGGYGRLFADQVDLLVGGQINSFSGAFAQIFLFMALLWRSFKASALCMVPNLLPLYFIFVLMGGLGIHLDLATVMIAGVVLGITVDDTIHLYHGYLQRRRAGIGPMLAIARSFEASGRAVLAISVVLIAQFALLAGSAFVPTSNFGLMTAVGMFAGQMAELLLLPALLVLKDGTPGAWFKRLGAWSAGPGAGILPAPTMAPWSPTELATVQDSRWADSRQVDPAWAPTVLADRTPRDADERCLWVCMGSACNGVGAASIWQRLRGLREHRLAEGGPPPALLMQTSCVGRCQQAPVVLFAERASPVAPGDDEAKLVSGSSSGITAPTRR
ncbi:MAG: MMPL family transporter [Rubrivivax sp.]